MTETKKGTRKGIVWGAPTFWINVFPLYLGRYKGFFQERGVDLKIRYYHGGPELAHAVNQGRIVIGNMGLPPFSKAYEKGLPARIIGSGVIQALDIFLVCRPGIKNITDLKGKRIGILSMGSCDSYFIRLMVSRHSINAQEVDLISLGRSYGSLESISSRAVDASFLVEPMVSLGENKGILNILARVGDYFPKYQWTVLFAREEFIKKEPSLIRNMLKAYRKSAVWILENPDESTALGSKLFKMRKEIFGRALEKTLIEWESVAEIDPIGLENAIQIQKNIGAIAPNFRKEEMLWKPQYNPGLTGCNYLTFPDSC